MAAEPEPDRSRAVVKTYVPAYQKAEWARHADALGMSHSEYVRTMVQAGRRGFGGEAARRPDESEPKANAADGSKPKANAPDGAHPEATESNPPNDEGNLERRVLSALADSEHRSWEELIEEVTDDIEGRLERVLDSLQSTNRITHNGRNGGYVLVEDRER